MTVLRTRFAPDAACVNRIQSRVREDARSASVVETAGKQPLIWGGWKAKYFCADDGMT
jgi:hypothetical protein